MATESKTENKVFTAFLDILGFKEMVLNNSHSELEVIFEKTINQTLEFINKTSIKAYSKINSSSKTNFLMVSDSIIIWSDDDTKESFLGVVTATTYLTTLFMVNGVPLRGGISFGNITAYKNRDNLNIFGDSIVNAYELERNQQWSGVIIDHKCLELEGIKKSEELAFMKAGMSIVEYYVPMKSGPLKTHYVCNWAMTLKKYDIDKESIREYFSEHNKKIDNWSVKTKIDNTIKFYEEQLEQLSKSVVSK